MQPEVGKLLVIYLLTFLHYSPTQPEFGKLLLIYFGMMFFLSNKMLLIDVDINQ